MDKRKKERDMRFTFLTGGVNWKDYGGKFISPKQNNGEFDYWFLIDVMNNNEYMEDPVFTYSVEVTVISPEMINDEDKERALESCGMPEMEMNEKLWIDVLSSYGCGLVPIWNGHGNNIAKLMKEAREQTMIGSIMFGFFMDRPVNMIGTTGWDALKGDLTAGLYYDREEVK
jgi:hypothetical protein